MHTAIVIPARYASTRFPGKPLALIGGKTMLSRVVEIAAQVAKNFENVDVFVATEDDRIAVHARDIGVKCALTSSNCLTGSDRVLEAIRQMKVPPDFVVNLQGDAPFTPPEVIGQIIETFQKNRDLEVITPIHRLNWDALDTLRENKKTTPFSGTTVVINQDSQAIWFSKNIIPAIRNEEKLREREPASPVYQHIGLYGFRYDVLQNFCALPEGHYEKIEGLEQLRLLENGFSIQTVPIASEHKDALHAGIDSPEDVKRVSAMISE